MVIGNEKIGKKFNSSTFSLSTIISKENKITLRLVGNSYITFEYETNGNIKSKKRRKNVSCDNIVSVYKNNITRDVSPMVKKDNISHYSRNNIMIYKSNADTKSISTVFSNKTTQSNQIEIINPNENLSNDTTRTTFLDSFFIASIPKGDNTNTLKQVPNSIHYQGQCGHSICNKLSSYRPCIINKYQNKNSGISLNSTTANLCFPLGIKICLEQNQFNIPTPKNICTIITTEQGTRYYLVVFYYYVKLSKEEFDELYETNPVKEFNKEMKNKMTSSSYEQNILSIKKDIELYSEIESRDNLQIPHCACFISKYPYIYQIEKSLEVFIRLYGDQTKSINDSTFLIQYLIDSIPIPLYKSSLTYYIPLIGSPIFLKGIDAQDLSLLISNQLDLLSIFSIDNIISIFKLFILEKKIIFIDKDIEKLSKVSLLFHSLIYPLQWAGIFIPVICDNMIEYLSSFVPYVFGVPEYLISSFDSITCDKDDSIYIVNISKNEIREKKGRHLLLPALPYEYEKKLRKQLKEIKKNKIQNDYMMRRLFIQFFIDILYDYSEYIFYENGIALFHTDTLVKNRSQNESQFYIEFTSTQLFAQFINNSVNSSDKCESWFTRLLKEKSNKESIEPMFEIKKHFAILPYFIPNTKNLSSFEDYEKYIVKSFVFPYDMFNSKGILSEYKRIINNERAITYDNSAVPTFTIPQFDIGTVRPPKRRSKVIINLPINNTKK